MMLGLTVSAQAKMNFDLGKISAWSGDSGLGVTWTSGTKTLSFTTAWTGAGLWNPTDLTYYDKLYVKARSNCTVDITLQFEGETGITRKVEANNSEVETVIDLPTYKSKFNGINFQCEGAGSVVFNEIYVISDAELAGTPFEMLSLSDSSVGAFWPGEVGQNNCTVATTYSNKTLTIGQFDQDSDSKDNWGNGGWWLASWDSENQENVPVDKSAYDKVVVRFSTPTTTSGGLSVQYSSGENGYSGFETGTTEVSVPLDENRKSSLFQVFIQGPQEAEFSLSEVYFAHSKYFRFDEALTSTFTTVDEAFVTLNRSFASGWNSLCLPFATTSEALGCKVYEFTSATTSSVTFTEVTNLSAGIPYLVKFSESCTTKSFADVSISSTVTAGSVEQNDVTFQGTFAAKTDGTDKFGILANGDIKKGVSGSYFAGYRAYFTGLTVPAGAPEARLVIMDEESTGILQMKSSSINNTVYYTLSGQLVEQPRKGGLYIVNGKKVMVR